jgi:hypothetical protein
LEKLHAQIMQEHADWSWITEVEAAQLKTHARAAMQALWAFHEAYGQAEAEALGKVAVVLVTTDVALKLCGKAANAGSPAARLMKKKQPAALIMDEMQRCPAEMHLSSYDVGGCRRPRARAVPAECPAAASRGPSRRAHHQSAAVS